MNRMREKLVSGKCDCGAEAQIPWMNTKLCYHCWNLLQNSLREDEENERKQKKIKENSDIARSKSFPHHPSLSWGIKFY